MLRLVHSCAPTTRRISSMSELHGFPDEARALLPAAVTLRRRIHAKPELGLDLPLTTAAVLDELRGLDVGIARGSSTSGLIVTLTGTGPGARMGRTILLRGDMDALPMPEDTGLDYASEFPGRMHACGHDSHTAMLVQAVHLLHRHGDELAGTVKFMFQPGEEGHGGARLMIEDGLLDADPRPDAAFALHIWPNSKTGAILGKPGPMLASADSYVDWPAPLMGAEDFSYVLQRIPGCMLALGAMPDGHDGHDHVAPCHSNRMILNEDCMAVGIAMHASIAHRFLAQARSRSPL